MTKSDEEAFDKLLKLVNEGKVFQIEKGIRRYEVSVWLDPSNTVKFDYYEGKNLAEAIMKIK